VSQKGGSEYFKFVNVKLNWLEVILSEMWGGYVILLLTNNVNEKEYFPYS